MTLRPAAFLDRDGTIIEDTGFVRDPGAVRLVPGAAQAIRRFNEAGWAVIVVTNQSGIARGLLTHDEYKAVSKRIEQLLDAEGAHLDGTYVCPHYPDITGPCDCRKPGLAHYREAITWLEIDAGSSLFVGDRMSDLLPARELGGRGILVLTGEGEGAKEEAEAEGFRVAKDLLTIAEAALPRPDDRTM